MTVDLGGIESELHRLGYAHSKCYTKVYVPSAKVQYSGDFYFNFVTPTTFVADIGNRIRTYKHILKDIKFKKIVPGHGPIGDKRAVEGILGYLILIRPEKIFNARQASALGRKRNPSGNIWKLDETC